MSFHPHILIFDSGVGGLSVAREVQSAYPQCKITYASDNAQFPYGTKKAEWLMDRVERVLRELIRTIQPDVIVIACNTASTLTLSHLRHHFNTPFVGVVPAVKPAAQMTTTKTIGMLATPATVSRSYTRQLIDDYANDCTLILHGSSELVFQAERKLLGQSIDLSCLSHELRCLTDDPRAQKMDTIILACTHFPLLLSELKELALPHQFQWVDSGEAIARRVGYWLAQLSCNDLSRSENLARSEEKYPGAHQVIFTAPSPAWPKLQANLPQYLGAGPLPDLEILEI